MLKTLSRRAETSRAKFNTRFYKIFFRFKNSDALPTENKRLFTYMLIRNGVFIDNGYNGFHGIYELDKKIQGIIFYYENLSYKDKKFDYPIDKYEIVFEKNKLTVINRKTKKKENKLLSIDYQFLYVYDNIIYYIDPLSLKFKEIQTALYDDKIDYKLLPFTNIQNYNTCELYKFKSVKNNPNKFKNHFIINVSRSSNADGPIVIEKQGNKYVFSNSIYKKVPIHLFTINDNYSIKHSILNSDKNEIDVIENYRFYYTACNFTIEIIYTSDTNILELNKLFKKNKTPIKINIILDIPFTDKEESEGEKEEEEEGEEEEEEEEDEYDDDEYDDDENDDDDDDDDDEEEESSPEEARRRGGFIGINRKIRKLKQY